MKINESVWVVVDQHGTICGDMECLCIYPDEEYANEQMTFVKEHVYDRHDDITLHVEEVTLIPVSGQ